jgi:dephospho-CoA kinase
LISGHQTPTRIGLTGGIGSGKSHIARLFENLGAKTLDADQVARKLRAPGGEASDAITRRFGTLDPKQLRNILSTDPKAKADLERILHPLIQKESNRLLDEMAKMQPTPTILLYEASLLVESGRYVDFPGVILVQCPIDVRVARIMKRDRCNEDDARRMVAAQISDADRAAKIQGKIATWIIDNDIPDSPLDPMNLQSLQHRVMKVLEQIASTC